MNRLVRVARIARHRSPKYVVVVLALRDKTVVTHIVHARKQIALGFVV